MPQEIVVKGNRELGVSPSRNIDVQAPVIEIRSTGQAGPPGVDGAQGIQGERGVDGAQGIQGERGVDGKILLSLDDSVTSAITDRVGYMDLKRVSGGEPLAVFETPLQVRFEDVVTV